ncbi:MAG: ATP-binding cassette domain-containing protein, partial [Anaerolineaceae bacterium]|nr:ATP-binding cassette domain-containing protein [Anaerolineaceae bacterium]
GVSFNIYTGEVLAMVGESGCGKTTIGKTILKLIELTDGIVLHRGKDITHITGVDLRKSRQKMQIIFQDPYESLNPRQSIYDIVAEPLIIHKLTKSREERDERVFSALESTGLYPAREIAGRYPHHLSGGQRQRVAIASVMVLEPEFIVADEPVSMLDVSIRAEILMLMFDLRQKKNLTYLFITHDLSLAWVLADRIIVLYLGKVVEVGPAHEIIHAALHPYTQALVSVIPLPSPVSNRKRIILKGETPSAVQIPSGCHFHPRCWLRNEVGNPRECVEIEPELRKAGNQHLAACHFIKENDL